MTIIPRINDYVELGDLIFQCNKRYKRDNKLFTIEFEMDEEGKNRSGIGVLKIHEIDKPSIVYEAQELEGIKKELMNILGGYRYE